MMKQYIEMFKDIDLRPCELVAIREIAAVTRRKTLLATLQNRRFCH